MSGSDAGYPARRSSLRREVQVSIPPAAARNGRAGMPSMNTLTAMAASSARQGPRQKMRSRRCDILQGTLSRNDVHVRLVSSWHE